MRLIFLMLALMALPAARPELPFPPESRWNTLPRLGLKPGFKPSTGWIKKAQELGDAGTCRFRSKRPGWTQVEIPFAVQLSARGQIQSVKVGATGCPELERYVEGVVRRISAKQVVAPKGPAPHWRGSRFFAGWQD
jgi:hypothetical protein